MLIEPTEKMAFVFLLVIVSLLVIGAAYPDLTLTLLNNESQPTALLLKNKHCEDKGCFGYNPAFSTLATANTRTFKSVALPI